MDPRLSARVIQNLLDQIDTLKKDKGAPLGFNTESPVVGYHKIRGLGAPLRMMFYYKQQNFTNAAYGADMKEAWFGGAKPKLIEQNACINLPYIIDGDEVVTQSNTCCVYAAKKLGIDIDKYLIHNSTVLDQTMDLRNDLMKVVYPFGSVKTKEEFPEGAKKHLAGTVTTNYTKLEGFCKGPYMCGEVVQSGDFALFEMLDQHVIICAHLGEPNLLDGFPKLKALHSNMKADPLLEKYFASDCYAKWAHNNALFTHFTGQPEGFEYGPSVEEKITF